MADYAIGDVQGCLKSLKQLLQKINFCTEDTLWFAGDLVNRGPDSLDTLRFIKSLGEKHRIVLGNHDLHLIARYYGAHPGNDDDTLADVLAANDCEELIAWLKKQKLMHYDSKLNTALFHAGLYPEWSIEKALLLAKEVESFIQSEQAIEFFTHMYGNAPQKWDDQLEGIDRLRCITNYFTRARMLGSQGELILDSKNKSSENKAWFKFNNHDQKTTLLFGHWAQLSGITNTPNVYALDTGCVWGYCLSALRLEDKQYFKVEC